jgi:hypothetical protein
MPLFKNAGELIRANLEQFRPDVKVRVRPVAIGILTDSQLEAVNGRQTEAALPLITSEVLFVGWHVYKSRILKDGYRIEDVVDQITSALSCESVVLDSKHMTAIENPNARKDRYGNRVNDRAILECMARHPRPELFSVIPKGDEIQPKKEKGQPCG